ncbi:hypothetical protein [Lactobacillus sp. ESL0225]|uniref:hypothetical protein n=1 Tax=Lactobacillus sp. ESL0225 TaxID=2069351 RepID=UPI000EFC6B19|nr:hypothetical protein [Lactobacillus sp. ESL0225]RMC47737.1 hypothetical protein F5ESL0225_08235 [Lactobacillus sp. ESL0225]
MLLNGKDVKTLAINGARFDYSLTGKHVRIKRTVKSNNHITEDGTLSYDVYHDINMGGEATGFIILTTYKNAVYIIPTKDNATYQNCESWLSLDDVEILD